MNKRQAMVLMAIVAVLASGFLAMPRRALASSQPVIETQPFQVTVENPCTGEEVTVTGEILVISHETADRTGGSHSQFVIAHRNVIGVGEAGTAYRLVGGLRSIGNFTAEGATEFTMTAVFNLVSQGGTDNFMLVQAFHMTISPTGEIMVTAGPFVQKCVGSKSS